MSAAPTTHKMLTVIQGKITYAIDTPSTTLKIHPLHD